MIANQRQNIIYQMVKRDGAVAVSRLMDLFDVSIETIRKDLLFLEQNGRLKRVHGGAVKIGEMKAYGSLSARSNENTDGKIELSEKAMNYINEGDVIAIDAGSTAIAFAEELRRNFRELTVVTHSRDVFDILCISEGIEVILCGGHYLKSENAFYGDLTLNTLSQLHVQKAFIFSSAISMEYGIFDFQKDLISVQREMVRSADKTYILADSSKFEATGVIKLCDMKSEYVYITDSGLSSELKRIYKENGIRIIC